jgi:WD repeat-containing protein 48
VSGELPHSGEHTRDRKGRTEDSHDNGDQHYVKVRSPAFEFPTASPPSIITEGSQGGPWRKKSTDLDGTEDEKELPGWVIECVLHSRLPPRDNAKCVYHTSSLVHVMVFAFPVFLVSRASLLSLVFRI